MSAEPVLAGLVIIAATAALAAQALNIWLTVRISRLRGRGELRGFPFRVLKFVPFSFVWGFTFGDLSGFALYVAAPATMMFAFIVMLFSN